MAEKRKVMRKRRRPGTLVKWILHQFYISKPTKCIGAKKTSSSDRIPVTQFDTGFTLDYMMELSKINIFGNMQKGCAKIFLAPPQECCL